MAALVVEVELFGTKIGRFDIPADDEREAITQYFGGSSIYRLTPVSEDVARAFARRSRHRPVHVYELQPPAGESSAGRLDDDERMGDTVEKQWY